ncbi:MAG: hypothetical protein JNK05_02955 [Myxococcales bacterium]|nr:hypothetical protein [Myxococcales bacterium]
MNSRVRFAMLSIVRSSITRSLFALSLTACASAPMSPDASTDASSADTRSLDAASSDRPEPLDAATDDVDATDSALPDVRSDASRVDAMCDCFGHDGTYCAANARALATANRCTLPVSTSNANALLRCAMGRWTVATTCANGCSDGEVDGTDECSLPTCACFVRSAWCGASAARHGLGLDPPCRVPLSPAHDDDLLGCDSSGRWIVQQSCAMGCFQAPTGVADYCIDTRPTPTDPGWADCARRPQITYGVHPEASDRMRCAGITAGQISQTIGGAPASAGYHLQDGTSMGLAYCAATDLRTGGMSETQIRALLEALALNGFAAWYRKPGSDGWPSSEAPHIHAVFAGVVMKTQLRGQVRDWLLGLNGLASHTTYRFWTPSARARGIVRLLFSRNYTPP